MAQQLATDFPTMHRPRYAVLPSFEHKGFIPYRLFDQERLSNRHGLDAVVRVKVLSVHPRHVVLDRPWQGSKKLRYEYLAIAPGTRLSVPGTMESEEKITSIEYLQ
ncbi:hypothetical protein CspHIS471_0704680 [Cutaneotrichosporon sp. HIS471]|nr:hypothetical protein CspHIS471_0704680 [Cutaneotrichosporon sp. HIS471]